MGPSYHEGTWMDRIDRMGKKREKIGIALSDSLWIS
jgi:hypothetical protein